jgi:hypothetical protein
MDKYELAEQNSNLGIYSYLLRIRLWHVSDVLLAM